MTELLLSDSAIGWTYRDISLQGASADDVEVTLIEPEVSKRWASDLGLEQDLYLPVDVGLSTLVAVFDSVASGKDRTRLQDIPLLAADGQINPVVDHVVSRLRSDNDQNITMAKSHAGTLLSAAYTVKGWPRYEVQDGEEPEVTYMEDIPSPKSNGFGNLGRDVGRILGIEEPVNRLAVHILEPREKRPSQIVFESNAGRTAEFVVVTFSASEDTSRMRVTADSSARRNGYPLNSFFALTQWTSAAREVNTRMTAMRPSERAAAVK